MFRRSNTDPAGFKGWLYRIWSFILRGLGEVGRTLEHPNKLDRVGSEVQTFHGYRSICNILRIQMESRRSGQRSSFGSPPATKKKSSFLQPPFSSIKILGGVSHETAVSSFCESSTAQYWWTLQVRITCRCFFASIAKPSWIKSLDCATEKWVVTQAHSSGLITKAKVTILRGWDYKSSDLWWQCRVGKTPNISKRWAGAERSCMAQKTLCGIIMHVKTQQWYLYTRNCR